MEFVLVVADAVAVAVEALVIVPEIADPDVLRTVVVVAVAAIGNLGQVALERVAEHVVAAGLAVEQDADAVVGEAVAADLDGAVGLEGREVGSDADAAIDDLVVLDQGAGSFLEADAHAGGPGGVRNHVVADGAALGVHEVHADGVVVELVALDDVVVGEHEVDGVAAAPAEVVAEGVAVRIPGDHVARVDDAVLLDDVVVAVPEAQTVAAHTKFSVLGADLVAADQVVVGLLEIEAEQAVVDLDVLDDIVVAAHVEAGIVGVVRIAGAGQVQAAQHGIAGVEDHHRALVAGIDGDLVAALDGQRLVDDYRAGVDARRRLEHRTGR